MKKISLLFGLVNAFFVLIAVAQLWSMVEFKKPDFLMGTYAIIQLIVSWGVFTKNKHAIYAAALIGLIISFYSINLFLADISSGKKSYSHDLFYVPLILGLVYFFSALFWIIKNRKISNNN